MVSYYWAVSDLSNSIPLKYNDIRTTGCCLTLSLTVCFAFAVVERGHRRGTADVLHNGSQSEENPRVTWLQHFRHHRQHRHPLHVNESGGRQGLKKFLVQCLDFSIFLLLLRAMEEMFFWTLRHFKLLVYEVFLNYLSCEWVSCLEQSMACWDNHTFWYRNWTQVAYDPHLHNPSLCIHLF